MKFWTLVKRNTKIYFKDKGVFFTSLITPLILLLLFITFLKNVYIDTIKMQLPQDTQLSSSIFNGFAGGWLISSILATSCITVAFCANMIMVQDKVYGSYKDLIMTPVKNSVLNLSYYVSTFFVTAIVCYIAFFVGLIYLSFVGFYVSFIDILLSMVDISLLVMFGTAISSLVCMFLKSQGAISAVSSLVSSMYGFICGAYIPLSQFGEGIKNILMFFPGTYGTGLIRMHLMNGVFKELDKQGVGQSVISNLKKSFDVNLNFFGHNVSVLTMYLVVIITILILVSIFVLLSYFSKKSKVQNRLKIK